MIKQELRNHPKELQENVMIVDLVRNDLTRSAKQGTVKTEELFGIHSFEYVHQMISTVVCELQEGLSAIQAIKNTFPMGSMTGAPKISAMQLMEQYERSKRGVYSGAIGYFSPDGDFDFNVVIRTLLYNKDKKYLSFQAGSAITADLGSRKIREELDALQVLGVDPIKNLVVPRFLALMLVTGLLDTFALVAGMSSGLLTEILHHESLGGFFATFLSNASILDLAGSVIKCTLFGAIIAIVCCYKGMTVSGGAAGVGRGVNDASVRSKKPPP